MNNWPKNRIVFLGVIVLAILATLTFIYVSRRPNPQANAVVLTVWGTDNKSAFDALAAGYAVSRPNVTIRYSQIDPNQYEKTLINAFASGQGPDVFMIGNHDVFAKSILLSPATSTQFVASQLGNLYPKAVATDLVVNGQVYALPLYMDTLALVYNKDLLDQAGIPTPPVTWQDFLDDVAKIRKTNTQGQLVLSPAAIGGTDQSIPHATDILSLLMLQNGATLTAVNGRAQFADDSKAEAALQFYTDFANPSSNAYSWSDSQGGAFESFAAGKTAMLFAYNEDLPTLASKSPFLSYAAAPVPQTSADQAVNFPSYQALAVWRGSKQAAWAWDFVIAAATDSATNGAYLKTTSRRPALRALISSFRPKDDIWNAQTLTARSWVTPDYAKIKKIFGDAVNAVLSGGSTRDALSAAATQINQLSQ